MLISGGTGSGKTSFLNSLLGEIDENQRVVSIEDSQELNLDHIKNKTQLAVPKDANEIYGYQKAINNALRLKPERLLLGEIDIRNTFSFLRINNTGHEGSLSTGLKDSALSVEFVRANFRLFLADRTRVLQRYYELHQNPMASPMARLCSSAKRDKTNVLDKLSNPKNEFESLLSHLFKEKQMLKYRTAQGYKSLFKDILDFSSLKKFQRLKDFQRQDSVDFISFLQAKNNSNLTIRKKARAFKACFEYALKLDLLDKNPFFMPK